MRLFVSVATTLVLLCSVRNGEAAPFTLFDGTFNPSDWSLTDVSFGSVVTYTSSTSQSPTGGNPDFNRQTTWSLAGLDVGESFTFDVRHLNTTAVYDPATSGAITDLTMSFDLRTDGRTSFYRPLLQQNGIFYSSFVFLGSTSTWTTFAVIAGLASNWDVAGTATGTPDFSASGAPIRFGYRNSTVRSCSGTPGSTCVVSAGIDFIDNFSVSATGTPAAVPEPASMLLVSTGLAGLAARRYRRTRSMTRGLGTANTRRGDLS